MTGEKILAVKSKELVKLVELMENLETHKCGDGVFCQYDREKLTELIKGIVVRLIRLEQQYPVKEEQEQESK